MASVEQAEYAAVLEAIRHWPPDARRGLVRELVKSLATPQATGAKEGRHAAESTGMETPDIGVADRPAKKTLADLVGLLRGDQPPPTDEEVECILGEERMKKYG